MYQITESITVTRGTTDTDVVDANRSAASIVTITQGTTTYAPRVGGVGDYELIVEQNASTSVKWYGTNQPDADTEYTVVVVINANFILKGIDSIKTAFVAGLRYIYTNEPFFAQYYRYNTEDTLTKIAIVESYAERTLKLPCISVAIGGANIEKASLSLDDELLEVVDASGNVIGYRTVSHVYTDVDITVVSNKNADMRKVTDLTWFFILHLFSHVMAKYGIAYKNARISGEKATTYQGELHHSCTITVKCYSEFQVFHPVVMAETINKLNVQLNDLLTDSNLNNLEIAS